MNFNRGHIKLVTIFFIFLEILKNVALLMRDYTVRGNIRWVDSARTFIKNQISISVSLKYVSRCLKKADKCNISE